MKIRSRYSRYALNLSTDDSNRKVRKHINADNFLALIREDFQKIPDRRAGNISISQEDALMSALAMFLLKDPSLLAFDKR